MEYAICAVGPVASSNAPSESRSHAWVAIEPSGSLDDDVNNTACPFAVAPGHGVRGAPLGTTLRTRTSWLVSPASSVTRSMMFTQPGWL
jgi:hypothetical protein